METQELGPCVIASATKLEIACVRCTSGRPSSMRRPLSGVRAAGIMQAAILLLAHVVNVVQSAPSAGVRALPRPAGLLWKLSTRRSAVRRMLSLLLLRLRALSWAALCVCSGLPALGPIKERPRYDFLPVNLSYTPQIAAGYSGQPGAAAAPSLTPCPPWCVGRHKLSLVLDHALHQH